MSHVLIPLDGSPLAEAVLPLVPDLEPRAVTLLHVEEREEPPSARDSVFHAAQRHGLDSRHFRALVRRGRPADVIQGVASEVGATLVALSTHGRSGFNRLVLGSVAEEVVRASKMPVLLTRSGAPPPRRPLLARPLVGYDGSELAWRAVEALALLGKERVGEVSLLGALDVAPPGAQADDLMERLIARQRDELLQLTLRAAVRARGLGLTAEGMVREGRPAGVLLEVAEQSESTLLAVATHGRSALTRWIFGSVAEELLHTSPVPLLVVR